MERKNDILSIFHEVQIKASDSELINGALIIANQINQIIIWWRCYSNSEGKLEDIKILYSKIQKIVIDFNTPNPTLTITTKQPSKIQQFIFKESLKTDLMRFIQILAVKQQISDANSIDDAIDFICTTFSGPTNQNNSITLKFEDGRIDFPSYLMTSDFMQRSSIDVFKSDLHIAEEFNVKYDNFVNYSISFDAIENLKDLAELKIEVLHKGISKDIRFLIWPLLCNILPFNKEKRQEILKLRVNEYLSLRNQWETYSRQQIKNFPLIQESFATIRVDVERTYPPEPIASFPNWAGILTNLLKSFSLWNLNVRYTQGLNDIVIVFMGIFLPHVTSKEITLDEAEALIFWCFSSFIETVDVGIISENMMLSQTVELQIISEIINEFHPTFSSWLKSHNLNDLSFLISSLMLIFSRMFPIDSITRIWESLISSDSPKTFLRFFSASLMMHSFSSLSMMTDLSVGKITMMIEKMFIKQNIGSLIGVAVAMMNKSTNQFNEKIAKVPAKFELPENNFFGVDMDTALEYWNTDNLFI